MRFSPVPADMSSKASRNRLARAVRYGRWTVALIEFTAARWPNCAVPAEKQGPLSGLATRADATGPAGLTSKLS